MSCRGCRNCMNRRSCRSCGSCGSCGSCRQSCQSCQSCGLPGFSELSEPSELSELSDLSDLSGLSGLSELPELCTAGVFGIFASIFFVPIIASHVCVSVTVFLVRVAESFRMERRCVSPITPPDSPNALGASRLVHVTSVCSLTNQYASSRHSRDARAYVLTVTAMHGSEYTSRPSTPFRCTRLSQRL